MKRPIVCLIARISVLYFSAIVYAISRGSDVRASLRVAFAAFSFEAKQKGAEPNQNK